MAEAVVLTHINSADLYKSGHMAHRWFGSVSRQLSSNTRRHAPSRSGMLKAGIHSRMRSIPQAKQMTIDLTSDAPYTMYVLRGTDHAGVGIRTRMGWASGIGEGRSWVRHQFPNGGWYRQSVPGFWMHFGGYGWPMVFKDEVQGQDANNFLLKGWRDTAYRHHSMRRIPSFVLDP